MAGLKFIGGQLSCNPDSIDPFLVELPEKNQQKGTFQIVNPQFIQRNIPLNRQLKRTDYYILIISQMVKIIYSTLIFFCFSLQKKCGKFFMKFHLFFPFFCMKNRSLWK